MSEFKLYHLVKEMLTALGFVKCLLLFNDLFFFLLNCFFCRNNNPPEQYIECLQNNIGSQILTSSSHLAVQNLIEQLAPNSHNSEALLCKFEELKQKE